jgi:hypothetical protein
VGVEPGVNEKGERLSDVILRLAAAEALGRSKSTRSTSS